MQGSTQAVVTPGGVRDGDPTALAGLVDRRGSAVLAFCDAVCAPDVAPRAAAEAFARFRAAVATAEDPAALNPEVLLLGATRHAAALMARTATGGGGFRRVLGGARPPQETCALVPTLLAARAEDMLGSADQDRLARHLERCPGCREIEAAFRRAERAYRSPPDRPIPAQARAIIMAGLTVAVEPAEPGDWAEDVDEDAALDEAEPVVEAEDEEPPAAETPVEQPVVEVEEPAVEEPVAHEEAVAPELGQGNGNALAHEPIAPEPIAPEAEPELTAIHDALPEDVTAIHDALPAEEAITTALPRPRRQFPRSRNEHSDHGPLYRYVLPGAAVAIAIVVIMAVAGVFGGNDSAPTRTQPARGSGNATPISVQSTAAIRRVAARAPRRKAITKPKVVRSATKPAAAASTPASTPAAAAPATTGGTTAKTGTELRSRTGGTVDKAGRTEASSLSSSGDSSQPDPVYDAGGAGTP